jgi:hypothetical protein
MALCPDPSVPEWSREGAIGPYRDDQGPRAEELFARYHGPRTPEPATSLQLDRLAAVICLSQQRAAEILAALGCVDHAEDHSGHQYAPVPDAAREALERLPQSPTLRPTRSRSWAALPDRLVAGSTRSLAGGRGLPPLTGTFRVWAEREAGTWLPHFRNRPIPRRPPASFARNAGRQR